MIFTLPLPRSCLALCLAACLRLCSSARSLFFSSCSGLGLRLISSSITSAAKLVTRVSKGTPEGRRAGCTPCATGTWMSRVAHARASSALAGP
ncbi:hypothetical protein AZ78_1355 [Lysobacter capsici AZ78]|uniref:Secreted protein n=1 Tax=Lysobacter capsici AZ78 TaxID=1444315 RepID=A0A108U746_9GAMM|nr:hypothetical protein AZ78_1355 [Lysobacter capsici AZ78]